MNVYGKFAHKNGQKVFSAVENELRKCDSFSISVAFITRSELIEINRIMRENFEGDVWERTEVTHRTKEFKGQKGGVRKIKDNDIKPIKDDVENPFEQMELYDVYKLEI